MAKCFKTRRDANVALTGNATTADVLSGRTFYNTNARTKVAGTLELSGTATAADVMSGKTFYNTDAKTIVTGTKEDREYIFKDGVFLITPTTSKGSISSNKYVYTANGGNDTFLVIPYVATDKIIILEINMTHCDYSYGHLVVTNGGGTTCKYGAYAQGLNLIAGIPASTELRLTNAYYSGDSYSISAIYAIPND